MKDLIILQMVAVSKISRSKGLIKEVVAFLFILLFVYAAVRKVSDFETFTVQLAQSPLLSAYAGIIAWLVPGIEIIIALLLFGMDFQIKNFKGVCGFIDKPSIPKKTRVAPIWKCKLPVCWITSRGGTRRRDLFLLRHLQKTRGQSLRVAKVHP